MFLMNFNLFYSLILVSFSIFTISFNSLFFTWVFMELNLLMMAPLLLMKSNFMKEQASLVLKYFLVQVVGSIYLLMSLILLNFNYITINKLNLILIVALMLKAGVPPLHFWLPPVMQLSNPFQAFLILCLQKIIPIFLLSLLMSEILMTFIMSSALLGGILGFNQNSLMKILAYSSMVHSGWMISGLTMNLTSSYFYYIIYTVTSYVFITIISSSAIKNVSEIINMNNSPLFMFSLIFTIFTLSGTPPFIGFFSKMYVLLDLISLKFYTVSLTLIVGSTLSFYFYLRLIASISLVSKLTLKDKSNKINLFNTSSLIIMVNLSLLVVMWVIN